MSENAEPQIPKLDLAQIMEPRMQLISPPPEEELQRTHVFGFPRTNTTATAQTKRKRAGVVASPSKTTNPGEVTPNPKPRKTHRRRTSNLSHDSPTRPQFATNPDADYLLVAPSSASRRRSVTPYEPPQDVFTPPREVLLAPASVSSVRAKKSKAKPKPKDATPRARTSTPLRVVVKKEPPPSIDRTRPMTPPSPTDDPLLLLPSSSPIKRNRTVVNYDMPNRTVVDDYEQEHEEHESSDAAYAPFDWTAGLPDGALDAHDPPSTDSMDLDAPASFDGPAPGPSYGNGWDSDDDDDNGALPTTTPALGPALSLQSIASVTTPTRSRTPRVVFTPTPGPFTATATATSMQDTTAPTRTSTRIRSASATSTALPQTTPHTAAPSTTPIPPIAQTASTTTPPPTIGTARERTSTPIATTRESTAMPQTQTHQTTLTVSDFFARTKPDPPTPRTRARAEEWGVWGSPWPGRGPNDSEGSFRMDGRGLRAGVLPAAATTTTLLGTSTTTAAADAGTAGAHVHDDEGMQGQQEEHQAGEDVEVEEEDEDEDESADEGVSFLRALREEDARIRAAREGRVGSPVPLTSRAGVHSRSPLPAGEPDDDEDEDEEEVRAMSVDLDPVDEDEDGEGDDTQRLASPSPFAFPPAEASTPGPFAFPPAEAASTSTSTPAGPIRASGPFAFPAVDFASPGQGRQGRSAKPTQTPPARRAPQVPARSERVVGSVMERSPVRPSAGSRGEGDVRGGGDEEGDGGEDVRMPFPTEDAAAGQQDHSHSSLSDGDRSQDEEQEQEQEQADDKERRTTPPVFSARGTRVAVPATPTRGGAPRVSFVRADPEADGDGDGDVELPAVERGIEGAGVQEGGAEGQGVQVQEEEGGSDGEDEEAAALLGLVKITSADPRAAARAAAILKQHDYDCFTRLGKGKGRRRHSYAGVSKASVSAGSGSKTPGPARGMQDIEELRDAYAGSSKVNSAQHQQDEEGNMLKHTRASTPTPARVVGERVYFPGSPKPVTTAQLLAEAEREVLSVVSPSRVGSPSRGGGESISTSPRKVIDSNKARRTSARGVPLPESDDESAGEDDENGKDGAREWTRSEWKALDACFTDERIAVAARLGMVLNLSPAPGPSTPVRAPAGGPNGGAPAVMMASADAVDLAAVVARFVALMGGERVVQGFGEKWDADYLTQRARALQNKQRGGLVAPPTPSASAKDDTSVFGSERRRASMVVPDFTPLGKRAMPPRGGGSGGRAMSALVVNGSPLGNNACSSSPLGNSPLGNTHASRARLPPPVSAGAPFSNLPPTPEPARRRRVPGSLFAPRYSHLLEEAVAVSAGRPMQSEEEEVEEGGEDGDGDVSLADADGEDVSSAEEQAQEQEEQQEQDSSFASSADGDGEDAEMVPATPLREREARLQHPEPAPTTIGKRVKGFIFSYLPALSKTAPPPTRKTLLHTGPRLPLPPLELLEKPRGPVKTPARPPLPKTIAPKELVSLQHAPLPKPKSLLPRRAVPPKRLVELQHIEPPVEAPKVVPFTRPRTSSGGSVKDLVKNFEAKGATTKGAEVKRVRSVGNFGGPNNKLGTAGGAARPMWRP
ncbi:hypothetical protein K438DRAFT_1952682 [Mycena galopus ATCC 62051]|nr:hypothetical protein K438DRAFT_1952682 [Mycena galopus ATCC 62051]